MIRRTVHDIVVIDKSHIVTALWHEHGVWHAIKGSEPHFTSGDQVDKIEPYYENGEMAPVLWFAIFNDGKRIANINGKYVAEVRVVKKAIDISNMSTEEIQKIIEKRDSTEEKKPTTIEEAVKANEDQWIKEEDSPQRSKVLYNQTKGVMYGNWN